MTSLDRTQEDLLRLVGASHDGVLVTLRKNGRPQLSNVNHAYDAEARTVRVSVTEDRAKTRNLRRDPRASFHVTSENRRAWTVVDGTAELTPPAADPRDATVEALITLYRDVLGEHPDWDDYRQAMVRDRRVVLTLHIDHVYGQPSA
ncbi:PPOX class F420-dependent oxidoreductase [Streptomyces sp. NPDC060184]|uniref:PPOX class F420-dependent oxidoreductase n=1 Tax=Streptomyces sp. NPDC060184 TaxID=3347064 RepID=UPI003657E527